MHAHDQRGRATVLITIPPPAPLPRKRNAGGEGKSQKFLAFEPEEPECWGLKKFTVRLALGGGPQPQASELAPLCYHYLDMTLGKDASKGRGGARRSAELVRTSQGAAARPNE